MTTNYHAAMQQKSQLESELLILDSQLAIAQTASENHQKTLADHQETVNLSLQEIERLQQQRIDKLNELKAADQALSGEQKKHYNQLQAEFSAIHKKAELLNQRIKEIHRLYAEIETDSRALSAKGYQGISNKKVLNLPSEFETSMSHDFKFSVMQNLLVADLRVKDSINLIPISIVSGFFNG